MPSRILLISTNKCDFPYPVFPLGLSLVDDSLKRAGHQTRWHDCQMDATPISRVIEDFQPDITGISLRNIDDVLFKRQETYFGALIDQCRDIRSKSQCKIVLGGSGFSMFPRPLMDLSRADFGIKGEGELAFPSLVAALEAGKDPSPLPGLVYRASGRIIVNPAPADLPLDWPPAPRPAAAAAYYLQESAMLNLQTQRGCAFDCCYCTYPLLEGKRRRSRPPELIAEEMEILKRQGARYVFIVDSVFNSSPQHVIETCEAIIRREIGMPWCAFLRPQNLSREQMRVMARAGLTHIEFGSDSFCDPVLSAYGKHFHFDDILEASELAGAEQIDYCHFLIFGGPGETLDTLRQTFENSQRLREGLILALPGMRVYPGTPLHATVMSEGHCPATDRLLEPHYYISPAIAAETIATEMQRFAAESSNWITSEPSPEYYAMTRRLRQRGAVGPLWSYLSLAQRVFAR